MADWYDDDEGVYRVRRYPASPPVRYVERPRSRERQRGRSPAPSTVVINNKVFNDFSDDEDEHRHMQLAVVEPPRRARSRGRPSSTVISREDQELEYARSELQNLRIDAKIARRERELQEEQERREYEDAKRELDELKRKDALRAEEERLKRELELERLKEAEREAAEREERDREIKAAIEKYRVREMERIAQDEKEREEQDKEIERRMQKQLIEAGLSDTQIAAIMNGERGAAVAPVARPTYTRMARRHLSFETLRTFHLEYDLDPGDSDYILIKRWVPEEEQDSLWKHTRYIREKRKVLLLEEKKHRSHSHSHSHSHLEPEFEWVRKSGSSRKRSKSPGLLMYLAGAK